MKYILLAVFVLCSIPVSAHDVLIKRGVVNDIKHYNVTFEIKDCVTDKIEEIPGVEMSSHNRYEITVIKGSGFSWTKVEPLILKSIEENKNCKTVYTGIPVGAGFSSWGCQCCP